MKLERYMIPIEESLTDSEKTSLIINGTVISTIVIGTIINKIRKLIKSKNERDKLRAKELQTKLHDNQYKEYLTYLTEIQKRIPKSVINKERKLRKAEFDNVSRIAKNITNSHTKVDLGNNLCIDFSLSHRFPSYIQYSTNYDNIDYFSYDDFVSDFLNMGSNDLTMLVSCYESEYAYFCFNFFDEIIDHDYFSQNNMRPIDFQRKYWHEAQILWNSIYEEIRSLSLKTIDSKQKIDADKMEGFGIIELHSSSDFKETARKYGAKSFSEYCKSKGYI